MVSWDSRTSNGLETWRFQAFPAKIGSFTSFSASTPARALLKFIPHFCHELLLPASVKGSSPRQLFTGLMSLRLCLRTASRALASSQLPWQLASTAHSKRSVGHIVGAQAACGQWEASRVSERKVLLKRAERDVTASKFDGFR